MIPLNKQSIMLVFCFVCFAKSKAQNYTYSAALDTVKKSGFYKINITPQLSAHIKTDFTDIRIADEKGKWIPHLIKNSLPLFEPFSFTEFPLLTNKVNDSGKSILIVESNTNKKNKENISKNISEIILFIKNASVSRNASISGSNDKNKWFIIKENILVENNYETNDNYFVTSIKFSKSDYRYFKIIIENDKADPLNVIKVGSYNYPINDNIVNDFFTNPAPVYSQNDSSNGKSYIKIKNNEAYHINKLQIRTGGVKFFKRSANIYAAKNDSTENEIGYNSLLTFEISSAGPYEFYIKNFKAKYLYLVIDNEDNPPLQIKNVETQQRITKVIAYLEKDKKYFLLLDNAAAAKPDYDLEIFKDSIPAAIDTIGFGMLQNISASVIAAQKSNNNKWWLWPSIIIALSMLGFLTYKLLGEIKKSEK